MSDCTGSSDSAPNAVDAVSPSAFAERLAAGGADVVDVRTGAEFRGHHVHGARHCPLDAIDADVVRRGRAPDARGPTHLLCKGGSRARMAATKLRAAGVECVVVDGGTDACVAAGLPIDRGPPSRVWALERQVRLVAGLLVLAGVAVGWFVTPWGYGLAAFVGAGLTFAGATDVCGMAFLLGRCPWNR